VTHLPKALQPEISFFWLFFLTSSLPLADKGRKKGQKKFVNHRYKIRTFESGDRGGCLDAGTIVLPKDRSFSLNALCLEEVERILCEYVRHGKLSAERVYQICPLIGNPETIRSVAIGKDATAQRVRLEADRNMYSEFRRLVYPANPRASEMHSLQPAPASA